MAAHPKFFSKTSFSEMERCAEIVFSRRQNAENEHRQTHKKQVES
jgi:hypothetical protein